MLTDKDLDDIQARQKVSTLEMEKSITTAIQGTFDRHLETNHKPLEKDIKEAHDRISAVKRIIIYATGFVAGVSFLVGIAWQLG